MKKELFQEIQAIQNLVADFVKADANKTVGGNQVNIKCTKQHQF